MNDFAKFLQSSNQSLELFFQFNLFFRIFLIIKAFFLLMNGFRYLLAVLDKTDFVQSLVVHFLTNGFVANDGDILRECLVAVDVIVMKMGVDQKFYGFFCYLFNGAKKGSGSRR